MLRIASPSGWTLAQMLVWILQQVEIPPQEAERFCNELKPKTIEEALNALVEALFNAFYGAAEGMPMPPARVKCGDRYEDLVAFFPPLPSLGPGALDALRNEIRQFIRQQPDIQFNPTWGRWTWPVCVPAVQVAPTPTRLTESAVADEAKPVPSSEVGPEEPPNKPGSVDAPTPAGPAGINVGGDPAVAHAIAYALKRARRPSYREPVAELDAALDAALKSKSSPSAASASAVSAESPHTESEPVLPPTREAVVTPTSDAEGGPESLPSATRQTVAERASVANAESPADLPEVNAGGRPTDHDLFVAETVRRLKENVPRRQASFARALRKELIDHPGVYKDSKGEIASAETIQDHVRDVFRVAIEAERRLKAGEAIPSTVTAFAGELHTWLERQPNAYRSSKTDEVMSIDIIEELVRDRFNKFWDRVKK